MPLRLYDSGRAPKNEMGNSPGPNKGRERPRRTLPRTPLSLEQMPKVENLDECGNPKGPTDEGCNPNLRQAYCKTITIHITECRATWPLTRGPTQCLALKELSIEWGDVKSGSTKKVEGISKI